MINAMPGTARQAAWLGAVALLCTAVCSLGVHQADEHFQILEFAGWKLGITPEADLPWEFTERMRPALQPAMVVILHHALSIFCEPDPFTVAMLLRMLAAALSFIAALLLLRGQLRDNPAMREERWLWLYLFLAFFLWFGVYGGVRFSSEGFSAALFAIGFARIAHPDDGESRRAALLSGILIGLAVVARIQLVLMATGLVAWCLFINRMRWPTLLAVLAGGLMGVGAGALIDRWFYGEWVLTAWNYIDLNVLQERAAEFGTHPWWHYFTEVFDRAVPPFSLLFLVPPLAYFALRRRDALTWAVLPFLVGHMLVAHKEYRFLFPVLPLLPALVVGGMDAMSGRGWFNRMSDRSFRLLCGAFLVVHVPLLLVVLFKPAQDSAGFYRALHRVAQPGDLLVHQDADPFRKGTPIWYTRPRGLTIASFEELAEWPSGGRVFYASSKPRPDFTDPPRMKLLYCSLPDWLLRFNIGGWADRTAVWRLWELQRPPVRTPVAD